MTPWLISLEEERNIDGDVATKDEGRDGVGMMYLQAKGCEQ